MQKYLTGVVVSNAAKDTSAVEVTVWKTHRIFKKRYKRSGRYLVHNPGNAIEVGTKVQIIPIRPISKRKFWRIMPLDSTEALPKKAAAKLTTKSLSKTATKKETI